MAKILNALYSIGILVVCFCPQAVGQPTAETIRSQTTLILIPTVVSDSSGNAMSGLKKDAFAIFHNGKAQSIDVFEEVTTSPELLRHEALPQDILSNEFASSSSPARLVIIALDMMRMPVTDQFYVREQLLEYLRLILRKDQPIALLTAGLTGLTVLHDFTAPPDLLIRSLQVLKAKQPLTELSNADVAPRLASSLIKEVQQLDNFRRQEVNELSEVQRMEASLKTIGYFRQIIGSLSGVSGRKALIWVSSMPPSLDERTIRMLNDANIAVYPVDARGLVTPEYDNAASTESNDAFVSAAIKANQEIILGFRRLADSTGGHAFVNRNDIRNSFAEAVRDTSHYYQLGFYLKRRRYRPGWNTVTVKVNSNGSHVRSRTGFLLPGDRDYTYTEKTAVQLALESPWNFTALPFTTRLSPPKQISAKKLAVPFLFSLPAGSKVIQQSEHNLIRLDFIAVAYDKTGRQVAESSTRIEKELTFKEAESIRMNGTEFENHLELEPGEYTVKFVVHDELTGVVGSIAAPLNVGIGE